MPDKENEYTRLAVRLNDDELLEHLQNFEKYQEALVQAVIWELDKRHIAYQISPSLQESQDIFQQQQQSELEAALKQQQTADETELSESEQVVFDEKVVPLYSKSALLGFSLFFSPISAGILLAMNLKRLKKKGIFQVMIFSIIFSVFQGYVSMSVEPGSMITILVNIAGALIMSELLWNQFIGKGYPYIRRSILIPLIIAVAIVAPVAWYIMEHPELMEQIQNGTYE
jgi:hypothetical protein